MLPTRPYAWMILFAMPVLGMSGASGQSYPSKPIRIIVGGSGGGSDIAARLIAQGLTASMGQQVVVENRPSGVIPGEVLAKAQPDGYTIGYSGNTLWILPLLQKVPYDPIKDFAPITLPVSTPSLLVVHPSVPVKSVRELIALAKAKPGDLNYGTSMGSSGHLATELFRSMAGIEIVRINYKGPGAALNDLIAGQLHFTFSTAGTVAPHFSSGRLRALAVTSAQPSALIPGLPTVAASGLPGYEFVSISGIFAPARTPAALIARLNREIVRFLNLAETKERFSQSGVEVVGSSPEYLGAAVKSEMARMGKVIREAGLRSE